MPSVIYMLINSCFSSIFNTNVWGRHCETELVLYTSCKVYEFLLEYANHNRLKDTTETSQKKETKN